jgi:hypothetical protein
MKKTKRKKRRRGEPLFSYDNVAQRFFADAANLRPAKDQWIHESYSRFIGFFAARTKLGGAEAVLGASLAYAWMPTILDFRGNAEQIAEILCGAKENRELSTEDLETLADAVNNSMVGASKLLHFVCPGKYAIWDSRVYRYLTRRNPYPQLMRKPASYLEYLSLLRTLTADKRFAAAQRKVEKLIGYKVTPLRAAEYIMFLRGGK